MQYFFVYMLKCDDGSYYTCHTDNIEKRLYEHKNGMTNCYTKKRLPVELVFVQTFTSRGAAILAEIKIKKWTRKKKEALINKNWSQLKKLAKKVF